MTSTSAPGGKDLLVQATHAGDAPAPRALLVFAHPDDETIALGSRISRYFAGTLIHVTDGAPRNAFDSSAHGFNSVDDYRAARFGELDEALLAGGAGSIQRRCLAVPDQEASLQLEEITRVLSGILTEVRPAVIFTHAYEGGHPDHDACAFAVHHALQFSPAPRPLIVECALYHVGAVGIETGSFLAFPGSVDVIDYVLSPEEKSRKKKMIDCFTTQRQTLAQFSLETERFRVAPQYDFTRPPHTPPVHYDRFPWGMTSDRFCQLAAEAERRLSEHSEPQCR